MFLALFFIQVNFWTFATKLNHTFCHPSSGQDSLEATTVPWIPPVPNQSVSFWHSLLLFTLVALSVLLIMSVLCLIIWRIKGQQNRSNVEKYFDEYGGLNACTDTSYGSGPSGAGIFSL